MKRLFLLITIFISVALNAQDFRTQPIKPYYPDSVKVGKSLWTLRDVITDTITSTADDLYVGSELTDFKGSVKLAPGNQSANGIIKYESENFAGCINSAWYNFIGNYNKVVTLTSGDATPDVSGGTILSYKSATATVTITDLDNPTVGGVYTIIGGTYPLYIADGGRFNLETNTWLLEDDVLQLYVNADDDYIQTAPVTRNTSFDYYVSTAGNDANDGLTIATAKLTLAGAEAAAGDGKTVLVLPGTYASGAITFIDNVAWYGYDATLYNNAADAYFLVFSGADAKTFYGFKIMKGATTGTAMLNMNASTNNNFIDCDLRSVGARVGYYNSAGAGVKFGTFRGCNISSGSSSGFASKQWYDMDVCTIDSIRAGSFAQHLDGNSGDINIDSCTINITGAGRLFSGEEDGDYNLTNSTINMTGAGYVLAASTGASGNQDGYIYNNTFNTTAIPASSNLIFSSTVYWDSLVIIGNTFNTSVATNVLVLNDDNTVVQNNTFNTTYTGNTSIAEIKVYGYASGASTVNISGNKIYSRHRSGWLILVGSDVDGTTANDKITGNVYQNFIRGAKYYYDTSTTFAHGILVGYQKGVGIKQNYVEKSGIGAAFKHLGTNQDSAISYNILVNNYDALRVKGGGSPLIYNNTIIFDNAWCHLAIECSKNDAGQLADTATIKNNIIYLGTSRTLNGWITIDADSDQGYTIDYNCAYGVSDNPYYIIGSNTLDGWAAIQAFGTVEDNGVNSDPDFATSVYYVKAGSPCIGAGEDLGVPFNYGLDNSTVWGTSVVTKIQPASWYIGAYVEKEGD